MKNKIEISHPSLMYWSDSTHETQGESKGEKIYT